MTDVFQVVQRYVRDVTARLQRESFGARLSVVIADDRRKAKIYKITNHLEFANENTLSLPTVIAGIDS